MALKGNDKVAFVKLDIENKGPLKIGDGENQVLIDRDSQKIYLPGTSIAGAIKNYLEESNDDTLNFWGDIEDNESKIIVFDSYINNCSKLEVRPGVRINKEKGTNEDKSFFKREFVGSGNKLTILIKAFLKGETEVKKFKESIVEIGNAIDKGYIRFGCNKSNGAGIFEIKQITIKELDLTKKGELIKYLLENNLDGEKYENLAYKNNIKNEEYVEFIFKGILKTPILIAALESLDRNKVDKSNIKNIEEKYIIPGSSLKGSIRSNFEKIAKLKDNEELVNLAFGNGKESEENERAGKIMFEDVEIVSSKNIENKIYNRIKIDRFTGGIRTGALMNEQPVRGNINFKVIYKGKDKEIIKNILFTLRDLGEGQFNLGSGNAIGRGEVKGKEIEINVGMNKGIYGLNGNEHSNIEFIKRII